LYKRVSFLVSGLFALALFVFAVFALSAKLRSYELADIVSGLSLLSVKQLSFAILLTIVSYVALIGYDLVSLYYIKRKLPLRQVAFASVLSYIFSNNLGFTIFTGNAIRYRYYKKFGLDGVEVAKLISLCIATFWVGLFASGGVALAFFPVRLPDSLKGILPAGNLSRVGAALLGLTLAYLLASVLAKKPFTVFKRGQLPRQPRSPSPGRGFFGRLVPGLPRALCPPPRHEPGGLPPLLRGLHRRPDRGTRQPCSRRPGRLRFHTVPRP